MFGQNCFFKIKLLQLQTLLQIKSFAFFSCFKSKKCLNINMFCLKSKIFENSFCFSPKSLASNPNFLEKVLLLVQYVWTKAFVLICWTKAFLLIQNVWTKCLACYSKPFKKGVASKTKKKCLDFAPKSLKKGFDSKTKFPRKSRTKSKIPPP